MHIGPRKILLAYTTALIRNNEGQLLLERRTDFDWWGLPGGVLELGETFAACGIREVREETGLIVEPLRLIGVYAGPKYDVSYPNGDQVQQCTAALEYQILNGETRPDGREVTETQFFSPESLPDNCPIWYSDMIRDCLAHKQQAILEPPVIRQAPDDAFHTLRAHVGKSRLITIGAAALVQDADGHVLLTKRGDSGQWGLPAGLMELGETPSGTIVRETQEELGITVEPFRVAGVFTGADFFHTYPDGNLVQIVTITLACRWVNGSLRPDGIEALDADFFDPKRLPPMFHIHNTVLSRCLSYPDSPFFT